MTRKELVGKTRKEKADKYMKPSTPRQQPIAVDWLLGPENRRRQREMYLLSG